MPRHSVQMGGGGDGEGDDIGDDSVAGVDCKNTMDVTSVTPADPLMLQASRTKDRALEMCRAYLFRGLPVSIKRQARVQPPAPLPRQPPHGIAVVTAIPWLRAQVPVQLLIDLGRTSRLWHRKFAGSRRASPGQKL